MSRINTNVQSLVAQRVLGQNNKSLGVSLERLATGLKINRGADDPAGLIASQNLRAESICEAQLKSYELALRLEDSAPGPVRFLNLGGGFGIPYFAGEQRLHPFEKPLAAIRVAFLSQSFQTAGGHGDGPLPVKLGVGCPLTCVRDFERFFCIQRNGFFPAATFHPFGGLALARDEVLHRSEQIGAKPAALAIGTLD